ncbi:MAG: hypothetical protein DMF79_13210 [Acidobacteria bacterium]|nr:MAG: hypothetical protein DMF79_13210 [Acidobacteriota bacterium]
MSHAGLAPPMVYGVRKAAVKGMLWSRIAWLSLRLHRRPWRAARALGRLVAERARHRRRVTAKYARAGGRYFWDLYAPGWPSLAFDRFVERELARAVSSPGSPGLQTLIFAITKRCPLRCEHCCEWDALNRREALSREDLRRIVSRFQERGVAQILLSGGEPLQRIEDILDVVAAAGGKSDFWILSSGRGLSAERAFRLGDAGLTGVVLSLDHWDPGEHDRFRGSAPPGTRARPACWWGCPCVRPGPSSPRRTCGATPRRRGSSGPASSRSWSRRRWATTPGRTSSCPPPSSSSSRAST